VHKFLVSPASRAALVLGKALSAGVLTLSQALIIYLLAVLLGVHKDLSLLALIGVSLVVLIGAAFFSAFSLIIVCLVKTRERFMGISLDLLILVLATTLLVAIGAMLYPRVAI
jgi:ABC-2 type transport system permease protein